MVATDLVSDEAPSVEMTVILSMPLIGAEAALTTSGSTLTSRSSTAASPYLANASALSRIASASARPRARIASASACTLELDRLRDRGPAPLLGLTFLGTLDRGRLGERGPPGPLTLTGQPVPLGLGLGSCDGGLPSRVGPEHLGVAGGLGLLLHLVPRRVGGLTDLGVKLTILQLGLALGDLLLLGEDRLVPLGLGERAGRLGLGLGRVDLRLDGRLLQGQVALRLGDRLLREQPLTLGRLPGLRLGDRSVLEHPGGLRAPQVRQVGTLGDDVLELEGVQHQTLVGQRVLGLLRDGGGERRPVTDDLLDGEPADDRPQRTCEHLAGEVVDFALLVQEPLGGGADGVLGAADLDDRHALQVAADALLAHCAR